MTTQVRVRIKWTHKRPGQESDVTERTFATLSAADHEAWLLQFTTGVVWIVVIDPETNNDYTYHGKTTSAALYRKLHPEEAI